MNKLSPSAPLLLLSLAAGGASAGPVILGDSALDAITAGVEVAAVNAQAEATGDLTITATDAAALVKAIPGNTTGTASVITLTDGTAIAASTGRESSKSTSVASSNEQTSPFVGFEINRTIYGTFATLTVGSNVQFGGNALDGLRMRMGL